MNVTKRAIEAAGGNMVVAKKLDVTLSTVWRWGEADKFKARYVQTLCHMTEGAFTPAQIRPDIFGDISNGQ